MTDARPTQSQATRGENAWGWWGAAVLLLALGTLAHAAYLINDCPLDLSGDEAHYWEWSRRLDWSYYSKGPLVAYMIAAGRWLWADLSIAWVGNEALAVRFPALLLAFVGGLGFFQLTRQVFASPRVGFLAVSLTTTIPIFAAGAMLMTIDAPLMTIWIWTLVCADRALRSGVLGWWLAIGPLVALGILAKYTMLLIFPVVGLAILVVPQFRHNLRRTGPYLATLIGLLGVVPILIWNAQHDWVSFRHVAGQAGISQSTGLNLFGPLEVLLSQVAVVTPLWLLGVVVGAGELARRSRATETLEPGRRASAQFLSIATAVPLLVFIGFSPFTKIQPNWPVTAYAAGVPCLAYAIAWRWRSQPARRRILAALVGGAATFGLLFVVIGHYTHVFRPVFALLAAREPMWEDTPIAKYDPTARLQGWQELGDAVSDVLAAKRAAGVEPFLLTDDYQTASQLAFYVAGNPQVYCIQAALGDRYSQYDLWTNPLQNPQTFLDKPVVYVGAFHDELTGRDGQTAALPGVAKLRTVECFMGNEENKRYRTRLWTISYCPAYAGFEARSNAAPRY